GWKIRALVSLAKSGSVRAEYLSVKSISLRGNTAQVTVEVESNLTSEEDHHRLELSEGGWVITGPLNVNTDEFSVFFTCDFPSQGSNCCP
ncbi:hypothetical protein ACFLTL_00835, partial [Chloroflexota bacterium]